MSKRVRKTFPVFGAFLVLSGIAVIAAVAYVSRSETDNGSTTTDTTGQDTTQDTTQATSANNQNATAEKLFAGDDNSNDGGVNTNGANINNNIKDNNTNNNTNSANINVNANDNTNDNDVQSLTDNTTTNINPGVTLLASAESASYGEITAYTFQDQNTVNVMPLSFQSSVFNELGVTNQTTITVAGQLATQYQVTSAKDGSLQTIVQIEYQDVLYDFRGSDEFLQHLDTYIQFTN